MVKTCNIHYVHKISDPFQEHIYLQLITARATVQGVAPYRRRGPEGTMIQVHGLAFVF
jgi:hypothetical protein